MCFNPILRRIKRRATVKVIPPDPFTLGKGGPKAPRK